MVQNFDRQRCCTPFSTRAPSGRTFPPASTKEPNTLSPASAIPVVSRILTMPFSAETINPSRVTLGLGVFTQEDILAAFRENAQSIGKDKLGYEKEDIGTHSNRSAAAMAMFMDDTPVCMIMLIGRWSSDAFLKHMRRQMLEFSRGMSSRMIRNDILYSIPEQRAAHEDPINHNPNSFATNLSIAPASHRQNTRPAFSLWH